MQCLQIDVKGLSSCSSLSPILDSVRLHLCSLYSSLEVLLEEHYSINYVYNLFFPLCCAGWVLLLILLASYRVQIFCLPLLSLSCWKGWEAWYLLRIWSVLMLQQLKINLVILWWVLRLVDWCLEYCKTEGGEMNPISHRLFYSACQVYYTSAMYGLET